ncbi:LADA_0E14862g1_1 [Lachancea dasiensis]|uniref:LADA_0E14862g1_1 n=1 Tax=Lachancea dasiensis TaxID=1072105 RepID=A0A1G4JGE4_9SACH|nr:LADA_0E14862g1_1 [Lachancea dasiensis]
MPSIAVVLSCLRETSLNKLKDLITELLPVLACDGSSLDVILTEEIANSDDLDYKLGVLYSNIREVLLAENLHETPVDILFNQRPQWLRERCWDIVINSGELWTETRNLQYSELKIVNLSPSDCSRGCILGDSNLCSTTADEEHYEVSALGGTFDHLHDGHKILLSVAVYLTSQKLIVGITDRELLQNKKYAEFLESFEMRCQNVRKFVTRMKPTLQLDLVPLRDVCGPTGAVPEIQSLIVSRETESGGKFVNSVRKEKGLSTLKIHAVNVLGGQEDDGWKEKISSTELRKRKKRTEE